MRICEPNRCARMVVTNKNDSRLWCCCLLCLCLMFASTIIFIMLFFHSNKLIITQFGTSHDRNLIKVYGNKFKIDSGVRKCICRCRKGFGVYKNKNLDRIQLFIKKEKDNYTYGIFELKYGGYNLMLQLTHNKLIFY